VSLFLYNLLYFCPNAFFFSDNARSSSFRLQDSNGFRNMNIYIYISLDDIMAY